MQHKKRDSQYGKEVELVGEDKQTAEIMRPQSLHYKCGAPESGGKWREASGSGGKRRAGGNGKRRGTVERIDGVRHAACWTVASAVDSAGAGNEGPDRGGTRKFCPEHGGAERIKDHEDRSRQMGVGSSRRCQNNFSLRGQGAGKRGSPCTRRWDAEHCVARRRDQSRGRAETPQWRAGRRRKEAKSIDEKQGQAQTSTGITALTNFPEALALIYKLLLPNPAAREWRELPFWAGREPWEGRESRDQGGTQPHVKRQTTSSNERADAPDKLRKGNVKNPAIAWGVRDFRLYGMWALREALEDEIAIGGHHPAESVGWMAEALFEGAAVWVRLAGRCIHARLQEEYSDGNPDTSAQWAKWHRRFNEEAEKGRYTQAVTDMAKECAELMAKIEEGVREDDNVLVLQFVKSAQLGTPELLIFNLLFLCFTHHESQAQEPVAELLPEVVLLPQKTLTLHNCSEFGPPGRLRETVGAAAP
ncbi:hypothetical protein C8R47DRAFT_1201570 [Mycena vitilis]|nr:hypothetical protein C8R47DRAFT_1201570 [Mycena vitilis]